MKILEPINELPKSRQDTFNEKYSLVFEALKSLKSNQYLPVEFTESGEADNFGVCMRYRGFIAKKRNLTVYVRKKED